MITGLSQDNVVAPPSPFVTLTLALAQKEITNAYRVQHLPIKRLTQTRKRVPGKDAKIAIISSDLRNHAIGYLLKDIVRNPEIFKKFDCIYTGEPEYTEIYELYKNSFDRFYEAGALLTEDKHSIIRKREIDLLIDLNGFTGRPSIELLMAVEIPTIHWLGLPSSTGCEIYDYLIVDKEVLPESERDSITETPIYLPRSYVPSRVVEINTSNNEQYTFASFQNLFKLNPSLLRTWADILSICSEAKFVIAAKPEDESSLRGLLEHYKFDLKRVEIVSFLRFDEHLKRLGQVDCILDTFPYNGGTSCADALQLGVPVVTLYGRSIVSRVAGSILRSADLDELVAEDLGEYQRIACDLYKGHIAKAAIQKKLQDSYFASPAKFAVDFQTSILEQIETHAG